MSEGIEWGRQHTIEKVSVTWPTQSLCHRRRGKKNAGELTSGRQHMSEKVSDQLNQLETSITLDREENESEGIYWGRQHSGDMVSLQFNQTQKVSITLGEGEEKSEGFIRVRQHTSEKVYLHHDQLGRFRHIGRRKKEERGI